MFQVYIVVENHHVLAAICLCIGRGCAENIDVNVLALAEQRRFIQLY